jgi:hypothetical protein
VLSVTGDPTGTKDVDFVLLPRTSTLESKSLPRMALLLTESQHTQIHPIILRKHPPAEIADAATCSMRGVYRIKRNLRCFGTTKAPSNGVGRPRSIIPPILDALCEHLLGIPGLYHYEMVDFVRTYFQFHVISIKCVIKYD